MGKNLIQQARGKGGPRYRVPSFNFAGKIKLKTLKNELIKGKIIDLLICPGHSAPLAQIQYEDGETSLISAPENVRVGEEVSAGGLEIKPGNVVSLRNIPEGTNIYNIEDKPGDGGIYCRTTGSTAKIVTKSEKIAMILLPSKKEREFDLNCRAVVGIVSGSGRTEKPWLKAGKKHFEKQARNKRYPNSSACKQNAVDHPFGNKRSSRKAHQIAVGHFAPPGKKVGKLWPRRTGRKR
ncbi:MAG: 50S ribosomal protein L2 [Nanoarchaeota archaeon]